MSISLLSNRSIEEDSKGKNHEVIVWTRNHVCFAKTPSCVIQEEINFILDTIQRMRVEFERQRKS
jgi:hypothetical protein